MPPNTRSQEGPLAGLTSSLDLTVSGLCHEYVAGSVEGMRDKDSESPGMSGVGVGGGEDASRKHVFVYPTLPGGLKGLGEINAGFSYLLYPVILLTAL